jgi:hypothetical protein
MSALLNVAVHWRRLVVRRPSIYWLLVAALATAAAMSVHRRLEQLDATRRTWGDTRSVLVAKTATRPGDEITTAVVAAPIALVPSGALDADASVSRHVARHAIAPNQILTELDVGRGGAAAPMALVPDGWLAVAVVESPASGAVPGDDVVVASDGIVIAEQAVVVGGVDDTTLVAVPAATAPLLPAAAASGALSLLRRP